MSLAKESSLRSVPTATHKQLTIHKDDSPGPIAIASGPSGEKDETDIIDTVLIVDSRLAPIDVNVMRN